MLRLRAQIFENDTAAPRSGMVTRAETEPEALAAELMAKGGRPGAARQDRYLRPDRAAFRHDAAQAPAFGLDTARGAILV